MKIEDDENENPTDNYWIAYSVFWICFFVTICFLNRGCVELSKEREKTLQIESQNQKEKTK